MKVFLMSRESLIRIIERRERHDMTTQKCANNSYPACDSQKDDSAGEMARTSFLHAIYNLYSYKSQLQKQEIKKNKGKRDTQRVTEHNESGDLRTERPPQLYLLPSDRKRNKKNSTQ